MPKLPSPLVTVVIPLHNYEAYIQDAIRSVQNQTLNNIEVFIVNDASTDNSEAVALKAIEGDARFHVCNVNFKSLSATRNFGITQGSAPFLACLDADDMMGHEEYLEVLVSALEKDRTIGIAFSSLQVMDAIGTLGHVPNWPNGFDVEAQYAHVNQIPSLCVYRRDMWQRAGGFRPYYRYVEDAEFWTTCIDIGFSAIHATTQPWFHYRLHNKSASQVHRTGEVPEPDWLEYHPWAKDMQRPFASGGRSPRGSWPVRFYHEPDVTIIIPVGAGHEEVVKDALHSVEGQTYRYWECVVVQDSPVKPDLTGFPWARLLSTKGHAGAGMARNLGAAQARARFLVFLDADDMLKPAFLERTLAAYKQNGRYAYTDFLTHDRMTNWETHRVPEYSFGAIKAKPSLHPITCLIPKHWFWDVGGFDEDLPAFEDTDLFMKLMVKGHCGIRVPEPLLIYNLNSGSRRKLGEGFESNFKTLLKRRYGAYMENNNMCNCIDPPKGKQPMAPTPDNAEAYKDAYGDMVLAQLVGKFVAEAPVTFRGPATRVDYGRRAKGDIFYIWQADLDNGGDTFARVENYDTPPEPTIIPEPAPEPVSVELPIELDQSLGEPLPEFNSKQEQVAEVKTKPVDAKLAREVRSQPRRGGKAIAAKNAKGGNKTK